MAYDRSVKVSQLTVDSMKKLGMSEAIKRANSGTAGAEFTEAAKRFYGNRVKPAQSTKGTAVVGDDSHYTGQVPKGSPAVIESPASKTNVSNNYKPGRKMA